MTPVTGYSKLPILLNQEIKFLRLSDRHIVDHSQKIDCNKRPIYTIIDSLKGSLLHLAPNGSFTPIRYIPTNFTLVSSLIPPAIFNSNLTHSSKPHLDHMTVLQIINENLETIDDLNNLKKFGGGNLLAGIGTALGKGFSSIKTVSGSVLHGLSKAFVDVFGAVSSGGSKIIMSSAKGTANIVRSSGEAIEDLGKGTGDLISKIFGGILVLILYVYVVLLTAVLLFVFKYYLPRIANQPSKVKNNANAETPKIRPNLFQENEIYNTDTPHTYWSTLPIIHESTPNRCQRQNCRRKTQQMTENNSIYMNVRHGRGHDIL